MTKRGELTYISEHDHEIEIRATGDGSGDMMLVINGVETRLSVNDTLQLGPMLHRARVCPLCNEAMLLEKGGRFPEHGCQITVMVVKADPPRALLVGSPRTVPLYACSQGVPGCCGDEEGHTHNGGSGHRKAY